MSDTLQPITIAVLLGSARDRRQSIWAARFVESIGNTYPDVDVVFVDPKDFAFPNDGNDSEGKDARYTDIVRRADGFFIVTPEYNHSFPGSLKRMLDSEYELYFHKPVALAGVSNGGWGGTRAIEALLSPLRTLGLVLLEPTSYFPRVQDIFDQDGIIHPDQQERYTKSVRYNWDELLWYARVLKQPRQARKQNWSDS